MSSTSLVNTVNEFHEKNKQLEADLKQEKEKAKALQTTIDQMKAQLLERVAEIEQLTRSQPSVDVEDAPEQITKYWSDVTEEFGEDQSNAMRKSFNALKSLTSFQETVFPAPQSKKSLASFLTVPYILWCPRRQGVEEIVCPKCGHNCSPTRLSPVRRIFALDTPYLYAAEVYQCNNGQCRSSVTGDDPACIVKFPPTIQAKFPVLKTRELGVLRSTADFVLQAASSSLSCSEIVGLMKELYGAAYQRRVVAYLSTCCELRETWEEKYKNFGKGFKFNLKQFEMPLQEPPALWRPPSVDHIADVQLSLIQKRERLYDDYMASLTGSILCMDHTFKVAKCLLVLGQDGEHERPWRSQFTVFNEFGEILTSVCTRNEQFCTLEKCLESLASRPGFSAAIVYVDNCCTVREKILKEFPNSMILLDMWHWLQRFCRVIPVGAHPKMHQFFHDLKQVMFDPLFEVSAKRAPRQKLKAWERVVPPPQKLLLRLQEIEEKHRDTIQSSPKLRSLWPVAIEHVRIGCLSDPQDVALFRKDRFGHIRCCRGTNTSEGHHSQINEKILQRGKNGRVTHDALSRQFCYRANVKAGIRFRDHPDYSTTDCLLLQALRSLTTTLFEGHADELLTHPYLKMPLTSVRTHEKFWTSYVHPVPSTSLPLSAMGFEALTFRICNALGSKPTALPLSGDFNFPLVTNSSLFEKLNVVKTYRPLETAFDELEQLALPDTQRDEVSRLIEDVPQRVSLFNAAVEEIAVRRGIPFEEALSGSTLVDLIKSISTVLQCVIVVAHWKSEAYFVIGPAHEDAALVKRPTLLIVQTAIASFAVSAIQPEPAPEFELLEPPTRTELPKLPRTDEQTPKCAYTRDASQPILPVNVDAPKNATDALQKNVIVKVTQSEISKLLEIVKSILVSTKKKNVSWDVVGKNYNEHAASEENRRQKVPLRFARDDRQLGSIFQNRKVYAFEAVKHFDLWYEEHKSSKKMTVSLEVAESAADNPQEATEPVCAAEQPPEHPSINPSLSLCPEPSPDPFSPFFSPQRTVISSKSLVISQIEPSPAPFTPVCGGRKRSRSSPGISHDAFQSAQASQELISQYRLPSGETDWVNLMHGNPHVKPPENAASDLIFASQAPQWMHAPHNREEELQSLKLGASILANVVMRCLAQVAPSNCLVVPYQVSHGYAKPDYRLPEEKNLLFLLHFKRHYIAVATKAVKNSSKKIQLNWWDSLREKYFEDERNELLAGITRLLQSSFPNVQVSVKKCVSLEQAPASNDCGVFALQNLLDFAGAKVNIDREMLRNYVS